MVANAISNAYLAESKQSQAAAARRATNDLSGRLKELQERLRNAENALAVYKAQNNFVGTQDTLISDQQLSASNQRLAAARAQTMDAKARYDQIEASRRGPADAGAIAEALQSPTIANLRAQYAEARKRLAELTAELGPRHPALRQTEKQVDDLRRTIGEEIDRFAQSAKNDLIRARDYEASLNKALVLELMRCEWIEKRQNCIALGPSGTGKTHTALGLALAACQKGYSVAFTTAAALVHELMEARDERRLRALQKHLNTVKLLIVDELGYVPFTAVGSELLFEVFSQRYERGSTLVTSNLPFDEWTSIFGSERLTGAMLDRLTHHVHILEMNGESYRLATSKKAQRRSPQGQSQNTKTQNEGDPTTTN